MPVHMNVMQHQLVGAYVSKLAMSAAAHPATVAALMAGLAAFVNDELGVEAMFPVYDAPTRIWRIHGVIEIIGVDEDAALDFVSHRPDKLTLHLPDAELLKDSRNLAIAFDTEGKNRQSYAHQFYYDYIRGGGYTLRNSDFLDSRIADYVFASCR